MSFLERRFSCNGKPKQSTLGLTNGDFKLCGVVMGMVDQHLISCLLALLLTWLVPYCSPEDKKNKCYQTLCESVSI